MASRSFMDSNFSMVKRMIRVFTTINVPEGAAATVAIMKWVYPTFGQAATAGGTARSYVTAPPVTTAIPAGTNGPYPSQYGAGAEGVFNIARTATGLYTLTMQDNYQRMVGLAAYAANAGGVPTFAKLDENTTISNYAAQGGSVIGLAFWDFAGAAVDPIGQVRLDMTFADATEP